MLQLQPEAGSQLNLRQRYHDYIIQSQPSFHPEKFLLQDPIQQSATVYRAAFHRGGLLEVHYPHMFNYTDIWQLA